MQNLEQIRAKNALNVKVAGGANDGAVVKKVPSMILENGILAAAAFANENKGQGYADVFEAGIIPHLKSINKLPGDNTDLRGFIDDLTNVSSSTLRRTTTETMAYLSYLRRFASK